MDYIYNSHVSMINESIDFINIINDIIDDMLMDKISICNNQMYLQINKRILYLISGWYDLSRKLIIYNNSDIIVYRGVSKMDITNDKIVQPIPFSSCVDFDNSLNWIHFEDPKSFIMKINIKRGFGYTFTGNLNEGNEVVLPAGILSKTNVIKSSEYNIVEYDFEPFTHSQMLENFETICVMI